MALLLHLAVGYLNPVLPKLAWSAPLWIQLPAVFAIAALFNWVLHWAKHENSFRFLIVCGFGKLALDVYLLFYSLVNLYQHSALP